MVRPINETEQDRARERKILDAYIASRDGCNASYIIMPQTSHFDAVAISAWAGKIYTWPVEIKSRSCPHDQYKTLILSARKIRDLYDAPELIGATHATQLLVRWSDVMGSLPITEAEISYMSGPVKGGRHDRGQPGDIEDVMHIDISRFKILFRKPIDASQRPVS
jgi:hypothetical protein